MYTVYSEERGTWNVFTDEGEWYFEGTYEQCEQMVENHFICMAEEEEARCNTGYDEY